MVKIVDERIKAMIPCIKNQINEGSNQSVS